MFMMTRYRFSASHLAMAVLLLVALPSGAQEANPVEPPPTGYLIQPGDLLEVSVWKEDYLERDILVRPDGGVTFPLAGDVLAAGRTVADVQGQITSQLSRFIPDPVVTVSLKEIRGNKIYVLGQVQKPGAFVMNPRVDIMQALALAGGTTPFANTNDIKILRRSGSRQEVIDFRYSEVEKGRKLGQNIILKSGDIIVVP
jgi:polysaccharide export outer membrane protein